ncbi:HAD family hydrolase [Pseudoflavonifractor phocaeensis]|uniref:HAD family hydrolase n=1 Tax=Pseudoflavonifractor phocaeensis TaxID=1870988 RepID=UPI00195B0BDF|nr:HAD family hydrolase [Pseudoflavonifractor phocaeensis]MBM6939191.1 HAD family hydrolase [Pseudoflavonifractor phocaeensis]
MSPVRLIACDLDGTLLDADHCTIPAVNVAALREASARGASIVIASGRPWSLVQDIAAQLGCLDYAVTCNGASVVEAATGKTLVAHGMDRRVWTGIAAALRAYDIFFSVYCEGECYVERWMVEKAMHMAELTLLNPKFQENFLRITTVVDSLDEALADRRVEKIDAFHVPEEARKPVEEAVLALGPVYMASGLTSSMEFTAAGCDKGAALSELCAALGMDASAVMAFGDGGNDVEMLRWAGQSYAMANAGPAARAAARYETASNAQGGVGQAVERDFLQK